MLRAIIALALLLALVQRLPAQSGHDVPILYAMVQDTYASRVLEKQPPSTQHSITGQYPMPKPNLKPFRTKPFVPT